MKRLAESLDYRYVCERLPEDIELADVIATLGKLNADPRITGILVLHPLPPHIPEAEMNSAVDPRKDIEAVHPMNTGLLAQGRPASCRPPRPRASTCSTTTRTRTAAGTRASTRAGRWW